MNSPCVIGDKELFAVEVVSLDPKKEHGKIYVCVSGQRIGDSSPVYVPTFASELEGVAISHDNPRYPDLLFSALNDDELFSALHDAAEGSSFSHGLTEEAIWNYFLIHGLDDAVDGWEIFVVDEGDWKRIVWRGKNPEWCPPKHVDRIWSARLPKKEFIDVIKGFVDIVK